MAQSTTKNGLPLFVALSALQKCIRRGLEREAMQFAVELLHTGKSFHAAVCTRLEVISHEDVGLADPLAVLFVRTACERGGASTCGVATEHLSCAGGRPMLTLDVHCRIYGSERNRQLAFH
jgi:replication-associated recombination protein RarA